MHHMNARMNLRMNLRTALACLAGLTLLSPSAQAQSSYKFVELKASLFANSADVRGIYGMAINNAGQSVGLLNKQVGSIFSVFDFKFIPEYNFVPTLWSATGSPTELTMAATSNLRKVRGYGVHSINNSSQAVGESMFTYFQPTLWAKGARTALDTRAGQAMAINDQGVVAGAISPIVNGMPLSDQFATLWRNGVATDLHGPLGLPADQAYSSKAVAINNSNQVAINTTQNSAPTGNCYVFSNGLAQKLPVPDGMGCILAGIDDSGIVVGEIVTPLHTEQRPARWVNGQLQWLSMQPVPAGGYGASVNGINKAGVIVGTDQGGPVFWRNGVQSPLSLPIKGLPTGSKLTGLSAISDDGKLVASFVVTSTPTVLRWGILLPQP